MNKTNQGFIIPAMIAIVLILTLGGSTYVYLESKKIPKIESTDIINNDTPVIYQNNTITTTSSEVKDESNSSSTINKETSTITTEIKGGTKTVTKTATSTKTLFVGNDGSKSSITISKEEEEYIKKDTVYSCDNENCFNESFKNCTQATMTTADLGFLGKLFYEIKPKTQNICTLTFKYLEHPNPEYKGKEMTCEVNNKLGFENSSEEMYYNATLKGNPSNCSGTFYEYVKYRSLP